MTEQAQHIINISRNLIERLEWIHFTPINVWCEGLDNVCVEQFNLIDGKVDLILAISKISEEKISDWKERLKPGGLLLFALLNSEFDIRDVGDALGHYGFINIVVDVEDNIIYGHAWMPKPVSITIDQIHRG